jgi:nucleoside-diphosphate-sugar epimerase
MGSPRIVVTGASGFLGRHVVEVLEREHEVLAIARGTPGGRGFPVPGSVRWLTADVGRAEDVAAAFRRVRESGGAEILVHLAGHYDFTGENSPEYERTNVAGTRHVLEAASALGVRDVVFASSIAACRFPPRGGAVTEDSPADGDTPYAASKRAGERLVREHGARLRGWVVRFAALYSDWCEYEPLFRFLETWLSSLPRARLLAGRGLSAVPYLHVRDAVALLRVLIARREELDPAVPLLASSDGATSHRELFEAATTAHFGERVPPVRVPRPLCFPGLWVRDRLGRGLGLPVFERPWMARMIDLSLAVDARRTRERLGWAPQARLHVLRRMPFLVQNRKALPAEWQRRNHTVLRRLRLHENLRVYRRLETLGPGLAGELAACVLDPSRGSRFRNLRALTPEQLRSESALLLGALVDSVRVGEKRVFAGVCRALAERRLGEGVPPEELTGALDALNDLCVVSLAGEEPGRDWSLALYDHVTMTLQFGADAILDLANGR